jgi:serine/threonine-protein kinase
MFRRNILIILLGFFLLILIITSLFLYQRINPEISVSSGYKISIYAKDIPRADGLVFDKFGNFYVTSEESKGLAKVLKVHPWGEASIFVKNLNRADGLVYNNLSNYFLVSEEATNGRILRIKPDGKVKVLISEKNIESPEGMVFDKSGNLFIAEHTSNGRILKFSDSGLTISAKGLDNPEGIAVDLVGNLFIAETGTGRILKLNSEGDISELVGRDVIKNPDNIIYDFKRNVFFVTEDASPGRVLKINLKGKISIFVSGMVYPQGMALDSKGNLFVSEQGLNRIIKISQIDKQ